MALQNSKIINILLWLAQGILALLFLWLGYIKLATPAALPFPWTKEHPGLVLVTGIVDLLGGIGIILPAILRLQPKLTIWAAYGILALMFIASIFHVLRGEANNIGFNIIILLIAVFIAWGRLKKAPIQPKI
ncbi:DoxX family protein [Chitinophaga sp.]|uniref:DoxX family protein n=1 Tax=Chitinophaga sp. TaxID=1869181 RepID=UPI0031CF25AA